MSLRIAVDMDGVMVDHMKPFLKRLNDAGFRHATGRKFVAADIKGWNTDQELGIPWAACELAFSSPGLFGPEAPPVKGSLPAMAELATKHILYIASSPLLANPMCEHDKREWIRTNLPFIDQRYVIFTHQKHLLNVDILLDDKPATIQKFNELKPKGSRNRAVCFSQPWNQGVEPRVESWEEFLRYVGEVEKEMKGAL